MSKAYFRREKDISPKVAMDASGGFMLYTYAFPEHGRAFNFMWRIGSRVIWKTSDHSNLSLG